MQKKIKDLTRKLWNGSMHDFRFRIRPSSNNNERFLSRSGASKQFEESTSISVCNFPRTLGVSSHSAWTPARMETKSGTLKNVSRVRFPGLGTHRFFPHAGYRMKTNVYFANINLKWDLIFKTSGSSVIPFGLSHLIKKWRDEKKPNISRGPGNWRRVFFSLLLRGGQMTLAPFYSAGNTSWFLRFLVRNSAVLVAKKTAQNVGKMERSTFFGWLASRNETCTYTSYEVCGV